MSMKSASDRLPSLLPVLPSEVSEPAWTASDDDDGDDDGDDDDDDDCDDDDDDDDDGDDDGYDDDEVEETHAARAHLLTLFDRLTKHITASSLYASASAFITPLAGVNVVSTSSSTRLAIIRGLWL